MYCVMKGKLVVRYPEADPESKCEDCTIFDIYSLLVSFIHNRSFLPLVNASLNLALAQQANSYYEGYLNEMKDEAIENGINFIFGILD